MGNLNHILKGDLADLIGDHARNEVLIQITYILEQVPSEGLILSHQDELVVILKHFKCLHDVLRLRR